MRLDPLTCEHPPVLRAASGLCVACGQTIRDVQRYDAWMAGTAYDLLQAVWAERSRRSLWEFLRHGWHVLEPGTVLEEWWHIKAICDHVQWILEGWLKRRSDDPATRAEGELVPQNFLCNAPPGVIKSRIISVYAPAWMWLHMPEWRVMCLSVNPRVAARDSDYSRKLIGSDWYQRWFIHPLPEAKRWSIRADMDADSLYQNTLGGERVSLGWGSRIVGQRSHALILDDPNDPEKAYSDSDRTGVNKRWKNTLANRLNDLRTDLRMGIQQRVHFDDWSAEYIRGCGEELCHLRLATEFDPDKRCTTAMPVGTDEAGAPIGWCDPRTTPGEIIHPARFTPKVIAYEKRLGPLRWAAQHQQNPDDTTGSMFQRQWFKWWKPDGVSAGDAKRPEGCKTAEECPAVPLPTDLEWWALTVDAAFKDTPDGSRVSVQCWAGKGPDRYLIDCITKPMGLTETEQTIRSMRARWEHKAQGNWRVYIEDKANGTAAVEQLQREMTGVIPLEPKGGKESRGYAAQPIVYGGNVFLPEGAEFLLFSIDGGEGWLTEVARFPHGDRDDQTDAMTQLLIEMQVAHDWARTLMLSEL